MIVKDYKLEFDAAGVALLWVKTSNDSEIHICNIDGLSGLSADQVDERVKVELASRGIEVRDELDASDKSVPCEDNVPVSEDLACIRSYMRKALKNLNSSASVHKKKDMIPVYDTMCKVSQVLINACKVSVLDKK